MVPNGLEKATSQIDLFTDGHEPRRCNGRKLKTKLPFPPAVKTSLDHQFVFRRERAVRPESASQHVPPICSVLSAKVQHLAPIKILRINPVIRPFVQLSAVLHC